jgi:hypothetical protein
MILWRNQRETNESPICFQRESSPQFVCNIYCSKYIPSIKAKKRELNISLNTHYIVFFKSARNKQQIYILARQVNPGRVQELMKTYKGATCLIQNRLLMINID